MVEVHGKCPVCGKPVAEKFRPFCSSRCSMIDLGKWLKEGYKIETVEDDDEESASLPNPAENDDKED